MGREWLEIWIENCLCDVVLVLVLALVQMSDCLIVTASLYCCCYYSRSIVVTTLLQQVLFVC